MDCKILFLMAALLVLSACGTRSSTAVIVAGSTSVQPFAELLAEEYARLHPDDEIDVQGGGSSAGIQAAESGTADIGMSSRHLTEREHQMWHVEIARDGLAVIVHPDNPIRNLSFEEIQDVYTGEITHWHQIGGESHRIHTVVREEGSGTRSAFDDLVMGGKRVSPRAIVQDSNGAVRQLISSDRHAIGFISLGLAENTDIVEAISINGVAANWENVQNGEYTLFRPFLFVAPEPPEGEAKRFVDFILSDEGQKILISEGLIPSVGGSG
jgi:phosphate transport system substrate-binding protein